MGLEALTPSTYISGLTESWPTAGEPKSQGDDHLRLIKGVLKNTFPNANGPQYGQTAAGYASGAVVTLTAADGGKILFMDTTIAATVQLPALTGTQGGWSCEIFKYTTDQNGVTVTPASGTIYTQSGTVATVRVGVTASVAKFIWSGAAWFCSKSGPPIGSTEVFDGATIPAGHLTLDGSSFSATTFAELNAALGGNVLKDKRGRVDAGVDSATSRLVNAMPGQLALGGVGGIDYHTLTVAQVPSLTVSGSASVSVTVYPGGNAGLFVPYSTGWASSGPVGGGGIPYDSPTNSTNATNTFSGSGSGSISGSTSGGGSWHPNVQPTIISHKIVRAC